MTPDITADTCDGAAGCASGSQTWNGMKPAFDPKPTTERTNRSPTPEAAVKRSKSSEPVPRPSRMNRARRHRSEEHTSELQSHSDLVCRLLLEKKKKKKKKKTKT